MYVSDSVYDAAPMSFNGRDVFVFITRTKFRDESHSVKMPLNIAITGFWRHIIKQLFD